jgi:hypothetical protein
MFLGKDKRDRVEAEKKRLIDQENEPNHFSNEKLRGSDILAVIISATLVFGPVLLILIGIMYLVIKFL